MSAPSYTSGPNRSGRTALLREPTLTERIALALMEEARRAHLKPTKRPISLGGPSWSKPI